MAKQVGEIKIVGTFADITFYKMDGQYYARMKSSLTGKRVKRDPRFARTMASARRLAKGSQLASKVYRSLPRTEQVYARYKELKSVAVLALKEGVSKAEVVVLLQALALPPISPVVPRRRCKREKKAKTRLLLTTVPSLISLLHRSAINKMCSPVWQQQRRPSYLITALPAAPLVDST
jgi:hypothetical protein